MNKTSEASQHLMILPFIVGENIKEAKSCFADCLRIKSEAMLLANQGNDKIQLSFMKELKKIEELRDHILSTCNEERSWCYIPSATSITATVPKNSAAVIAIMSLLTPPMQKLIRKPEKPKVEHKNI